MYYTLRCSHGPTAVYAINSVIYHGADFRGVSSFNGELVINFTSQPNIHSSLAQIPELAQHLVLPYKELMVPWPDMGVPCVKPEFWQALHKYIQDNKYEHVCFHCQMGHGRTGTALAAMLVANVGYSAKEAVEFVRQEYCKEAVETFSQTSYLQELDTTFNKRSYKEGSEESPVPSSVSIEVDLNSDDGGDANMGVDEEDSEEISMYEEDDEEEKKIIFD